MHTETFAATLDSLDPLSTFVKAAAIEAGLSDSEAYLVDLATNEAATNIIEYAYKGVADGTFQCSISADSQGITVELRDEGETFQVEQVAEPDFSVPLEDLPGRGAGLRIIRGAMDEVEYKPLPEGGTLLRMRKNRSG